MQLQWLGRLERLPYKQVLHGFAFDIITSAMEFRFSSHLLHSQEVPSERLQGEGSNPTLTQAGPTNQFGLLLPILARRI
jgi:hypothetical protein